MKKGGMKITEWNYEAYLLDRMEGTLTAREEEELERFLREHPELQEEWEEALEIRLVPPEESFRGKESLKRPDPSFASVDERNVEDAIIASYEGLLNSSQQETLERYLAAHPEAKALHRLYGKITLQPSREEYPRKDALYHKRRMRPLWFFPAAAAGVALLAALFFLFRPQPPHESSSLPEVVLSNPAVSKDISLRKETEVSKIPSLNRVKPAERVAEAGQRDLLPPHTRERSLPPESPAGKRSASLEPVPVIEQPLPVDDLALRQLHTMDIFSDRAGENLLAEEDSPSFFKKILQQNKLRGKVDPKVLLVNGLTRLNEEALKIGYEKVEDPEQGVEYIAVTSRFFSFVRRREQER